MKRIAIATAVLLLVVVVGAVVVPRGWAQAPTVYAGQAFDVLANHDGANTTSYAMTISGPVAYQATLPVSALSGGVITFAVATDSALVVHEDRDYYNVEKPGYSALTYPHPLAT